ncbi:hypothetical protein N7466_001695 [Penicillium verhagenii]|uniref:uncharacterized protein n=1 Tax=Penicillium verhagenii TaxID=1562060 RepID=UPI002544F176|nr:uncharacterized protein N7466_001695 [Penicillium verhagenii]KAJ5938561.1 hypothetical protein N7466_001695 [Penicillium verhagenii]
MSLMPLSGKTAAEDILAPRINWPRLIVFFQKKLSEQVAILNPAVSDEIVTSFSVIETIQTEGRRCDTDHGYYPDLGIYHELTVKSPDWVQILILLYWRTAQQAFAWAMFCSLLRRGTVEFDCLEYPMDLFQISSNAHAISSLLFCFPAVQEIFEPKSEISELQAGPWYSALDWLSAAIARSGVAISQLVKDIEDSGIFGGIDQQAYTTFKKKERAASESSKSP